jgi:proteasome lid subunit RPN8/RPN11
MIIKKALLKNILALCAEAHPREVGGIMLGKPVVDDYLIIPGKFNYSSVYIHMDRIPIYPNLMGTFHSHPSPHAVPSGADLDLFRRIGQEHLIIAHPYNEESVRAYDSFGKPVWLSYKS